MDVGPTFGQDLSRFVDGPAVVVKRFPIVLVLQCARKAMLDEGNPGGRGLACPGQSPDADEGLKDIPFPLALLQDRAMP